MLPLLLLAALPALVLADTTVNGYALTQRPPGKIPPTAKAFIVLGDSFSDFNNAWTASKGTHPEPTHGYWQGRFSNGPMWVEHVQNLTGAVLIDTANAGSSAADPTTINGQINSGISFPIPDMNAQADMIIRQYGRSLRARSTAYLWAGSADISYLIMSVLGLSGPNTTTQGQIDGPTAFRLVQNVPTALGAVADKLLQKGVTNKVIISTMQPIEAQPIWNYGIAMMPEQYRAGAMGLIQGLTQAANHGIWEQAKALGKKYKKAKVEVFDAYSFYYGQLATAMGANITVTKDCCVISAPVPVLPTDLTATGIASTCPNPDNFFFWDSSHPTRVFHQILGTHIADMLRVSGF